MNFPLLPNNVWILRYLNNDYCICRSWCIFNENAKTRIHGNEFEVVSDIILYTLNHSRDRRVRKNKFEILLNVI